MKNNLSTILGSKLMSITDLSKATGISRATLTEIYYRRNNSVRLDTLTKICDYLQISLSELIEYEPLEKEWLNEAITSSVS